MSTPRAWTLSGLAVEFGQDRRTIASRISRHGIAPVGKQGNAKTYRLADVFEATMRDRETDGARHAQGSTPNNAQAETARLTRARANLAAIEEQEKLGLLSSVDRCVRAVGAMGIVVKSRANNLPGRAAPLIHDASSVPEARKILAELVREWLEELQRIENEYLETLDPGNPGPER